MDAMAVVYDLLDKGTINEGDKQDITKESNRDEQNKILRLILKQKCTNKDLMDACDMIIAVKGNPRMTALELLLIAQELVQQLVLRGKQQQVR